MRLLEAVFLRTSLTSRLLLRERVLAVDLPVRELVPLVVLLFVQDLPLVLGVLVTVRELVRGVEATLLLLLITFTVL